MNHPHSHHPHKQHLPQQHGAPRPSSQHAGSLTHYPKVEALPQYRRLLNGQFAEGRYFKSECSYLALELHDKSVMAIAIKPEHTTYPFMVFLNDLKEAGFTVASKATAEKEVVKRLLEAALSDSRANKQDESSAGKTEFHRLVKMALEKDASDIHLEMRDTGTDVRMRVYGDLLKMAYLDNEIARKVIQLALTDLADPGNKPQNYVITQMQESGITTVVDGVTVKLRDVTFPAYTRGEIGQDLVMRVLPMSGSTNATKTLPELGYYPDQIEILDAARSAPHGLIALAGSTGSGKSTTLNCLIRSEMDESDGTKKIISIEDPPEFAIDGITQVPVTRTQDERGNVTSDFAKALRASMRGDPDIIVGGEVRDEETAIVTTRAVLTGHMVMTTLHTSSAAKIPARLADLGVKRDILGGRDFFVALVYQKLAKRLCSCSIPILKYDGPDHELMTRRMARIKRLGGRIHGLDLSNVRARNRDGCPECRDRNPGIAGRLVLAEVIPITPKIADFIRDGDENGMIDFWQGNNLLERTCLGAGLRRMMEGVLSPDEFEDGCFGRGDYLRELGLIE